MAFAQDFKNMEVVSIHPPNFGNSDIWGWVDESDNNREYALLGGITSIEVVDLLDPVNPQSVYLIPGGFSIWRDLKTWNNHCYVVDDQAGEALVILDLNGAPNNISHITVDSIYVNGTTNYFLSQTHNIYIDEFGYAYLTGTSVYPTREDKNNGTNGFLVGCLILDLKDNPKQPRYAGEYQPYVHDAFVRDNIMYAAQVYNGIISVVDVSDKTNLVVMGTTPTSGSFSHNCWLSEDDNYLFTTDEIENGFLDSYDVSDFTDIKLLDKIQSNPGTNTIPHNCIVKGNFLFTSYYADGITIHDVTHPDNMVEVAYLDTSPDYVGNDAGGFHGAWGVYPFLPSGLILISDIEEGLYVLSSSHQQAAYIHGTVVDVSTNNPIPFAQIDLGGGLVITETDPLGEFKIGYADAGNYQLTADKFGFLQIGNVTANAVNGEVIEVTIEMIGNGLYINGSVSDIYGNAIDGVSVTLSSDEVNETFTSTTAGSFTLGPVIDGVYDIIITSWGYQPVVLEDIELDPNNSTISVEMTPGYYDNFESDFGWTISGNASAGIWVRDIPIGTDFEGTTINPDTDVSTDFGDFCFVTGNSDGGNPGADDVDDGSSILTTPVMDLSNYNDPYLHYHWWFANDGGSEDLNDSFTISITNGDETVELESITAALPLSQWMPSSFKLDDYIEMTNTMQVIFDANDNNPGHLVEAGLDVFSIVDSLPGPPINTVNVLNSNLISAYPNPFKDELGFYSSDFSANSMVNVYGVNGAVVWQGRLAESLNINTTNWNNGIYFYNVIEGSSVVKQGKLVKQ